MEAKMKLIRWAALIVAAISILLSGVGCQQKTSTDTGGGGGDVVGSVQILTGVRNDTLAFLPNDSASTNVTVIVTDTRGLAMPNQKVNIALLDNDLGSIEFVDTDLKDTTNALGRVNCVFRVYNEAGNQVISATAGGVTAQVSIAVRQADEEINLRKHLELHDRLRIGPKAQLFAQPSPKGWVFGEMIPED